MCAKWADRQHYRGFEQGPIRPPSEASSLLIRLTRNCPWNRCRFCPVYKGGDFSLRPVEHVKRDIDSVGRYIEKLRALSPVPGLPVQLHMRTAASELTRSDQAAMQAALHWYAGGMQSIFLQDANSLILPPDALLDILTYLRRQFPWIKRITSYARSHTIARIKLEDLKALAAAGLNRIHIGLESGSNRVLKMMRKGASRETHIKAGQKVVAAGMELSEYVMPGLGGRVLSTVHAQRTAEALNHINPHFIRLRTLAIPDGLELHQDMQAGRFTKCSDVMVVKEIVTLLEQLDGITSTVKSDHILNLFEEVQGLLPDDKPAMLAPLKRFLSWPPEQQCMYQVGRRLGLFRQLSDMDKPQRLTKVRQVCAQMDISPDNVDQMIAELMRRFI